MAAGQPGIAAAATAPVEYELARKIGRSDTGLDLKRGLVFLVTHHVITVPLAAKALGIRVAGKPGYTRSDRIAQAARRASQRPGRVSTNLEWTSASRTGK